MLITETNNSFQFFTTDNDILKHSIHLTGIREVNVSVERIVLGRPQNNAIIYFHVFFS